MNELLGENIMVSWINRLRQSRETVRQTVKPYVKGKEQRKQRKLYHSGQNHSQLPSEGTLSGNC